MTLLLTLLPTLLGIATSIPTLVADVENVINLLKGTTTLDPAIQKQIDDALDTANQQLQLTGSAPGNPTHTT